MTESRPKARPSSGPVFWTSIVLFCVLFSLLVYRSSLGASSPTVSGDKPTVRKVIERRVITTIVPSSSAGPVQSGTAPVSPTSEVAAEPEPEPVVTSAS